MNRGWYALAIVMFAVVASRSFVDHNEAGRITARMAEVDALIKANDEKLLVLESRIKALILMCDIRS